MMNGCLSEHGTQHGVERATPLGEGVGIGSKLEMMALTGMPEVKAGDDLASMIDVALRGAGESWQHGDVLAVAQKIVSKSEGRVRWIAQIQASDEACRLAARCGKDARKVQAILDESVEILRVADSTPEGVIIARHRQGWVCANAGIDESNLGELEGQLLLLPLDPDESARRIAEGIEKRAGVRPGVVITDTFGRPWRRGLLNVALGCAGVTPIIDWVGWPDAYGRSLRVSQQALADEVAAASGLLMPKNGGTPVVLIRHLRWRPDEQATARHYVRALKEDLFR